MTTPDALALTIPISIDATGISRSIAAELRRMADAIDPGGARPSLVQNFYAPVIGGGQKPPAPDGATEPTL